jgi:putative Mg2+ transporter-C (MgtC) family protein
MGPMPLVLTGTDLAIRLIATAIAGTLIGLNRGEHGRPAGLRTTLLVGLAAALAMIEVNLLLPMAGKEPGSFVTNDLMRLPLGILSGMGFIGGGAILRRGTLVQGVTTAATLWMMTMIGLCFGGGQILVGAIGSAFTLVILWALKRVEARMTQEQHATLDITLTPDDPPVAAIADFLAAGGLSSTLRALAFDETGRRQLSFQLRWRGTAHEPKTPDLARLSVLPGVVALKWSAEATPPL